MIEEGRGRTKEQLEHEWCIEHYIEEGYSKEEAEERCKNKRFTGLTSDTHVSSVKVAHDSEKKSNELSHEDKEFVRASMPHFGKSDSLGIRDRDPTPLERCMGCRMDIYGETEEQARKTCTKMFNDPMFKHAFTEGKPEAMGAALFRWDYNHSPKYESFRERDRQEKKSVDKHVAEIIREIRGDTNDPDRYLPDITLKERAERIYRQRQEARTTKTTREARREGLTVGDLYGKTAEQIIREQAEDRPKAGKDIYRMDTPFRTPKPKTTVGSLYMKTRSQILAEDSQWSAYPKLKAEFDKCVRQRIADGMTRGEAEAHCLAATLPSDEPGPHAKKLRKGPM